MNILQIEFPSILLPNTITSGSIVDITVSRNLDSERSSKASFASLQSSILQTYGLSSPSPPILRCRNATQTSIVLEWDKLELATSSFRSLSLFRNGAKAGNIPFQPGGKREVVLSTKISGLAVDTEYVFHLVLRTTGGTYTSEKLAVRTHKMTDLTGITVTPGVLDPQILSSLHTAVDRIGGKVADTVRIDTTHFVCTEGRGREWERAMEMNIPVVRPEWVEGCEREGRIVGVRAYYLNADPRLRQAGQGVGRTVIQTQEGSQQQGSSDAVDRRDLADRTRGERGSVASPGIQQQSSTTNGGRRLEDADAGQPPPPTPAKDYKVDPMAARGAALNNSHASNSAPDDDRSEAESEVVSPMASEDHAGQPDALGISSGGHGSERDASDDDEDEHGEEDDRQEQARQRKAGVKLQETDSNFSEVAL